MRSLRRVVRPLGSARKSLFVLGIALVASLASVSGQAASYVYDANGRLRAVTTVDGNSAEYLYDALGNLLAVNSVPAGALAIFSFTPNHGPTVTSVTISGQGYGASPGAITVKFNGTSASFNLVNPTKLTAVVPAGATTGQISVQVGSNTATSFDDFVVTNDPSHFPPLVTSFTPAVADANSTITVNGVHFAQTSGLVQAGVNAATAYVNPYNDTQLAFSVLPLATSGLVTVTTPYGAAQSAQPLIVVPTTIGASNVVASAALTSNGTPQLLSINTASKYAVAAFSSAAGQWQSLQFSQFSATPSSAAVTLTVLDPVGDTVATSTINATNTSLHLPRLLRSGWYTVLATPGAAVPAQFAIAVETNPQVGLNSGFTVSTPSTAQSKRRIFTATQGENLGLGLTNVTVVGDAYNDVNVVVTAPDGSSWKNQWCNINGGGCDSNLSNAPATGTYTVTFRSDVYGGTFSLTGTLTDDVVVALPMNSATPMSTSAAGQNGRFAFSGTAGTNVSLAFTGLTTTPANKPIAFTVFKPDGTPMPVGQGQLAWYSFNLMNLPATGTYQAFVDPGTATASLTARAILNPVGTMPAGGSTAVATTINGQSVSYTFTATQGENLGLGLTNVTVVGDAYNDVNVVVTAPDGSSWKNQWCNINGGGCDVNLSNAPATGTYTVTFRSDVYGGTFSLTATLTDDVVVALPMSTATPMSTTAAGQNGRFTFNGTAGTNVSLAFTGFTTTPANKPIAFTVYKPDGTTMPAGQGQLAWYSFNLTNLPATGTYQVFVDPGTATANLTAQAILNPNGTMPVGSSTAVSTTINGQSVSYTYTATQGENLGLGLTNVTVIGDAYNDVSVTVYAPNGSNWKSTVCNINGGGCDLNLSNAPATGTYTVTFRSDAYGGTFSLTATLTDDVVVALPMSTATPMSTTAAGQNGRFTFSGTAGTNVSLAFTGFTTTPASKPIAFTVYKPDGTTMPAGQGQLAWYSFNLTNLPATGTYQAFVDPGTATANLTAQAILNPNGTMPVGSSTAVSTTINGQSVSYTYTATQGENLGLGLTNVSVIGDAYNDVSVTVYAPSGSNWKSTVCNISGGGCDLNLSNAPTTGSYTVTFRSDAYGGTFSLTATLTDDVVVALPANTATAISTTNSGQNGRYTFTGTAGTNVSLAISGIATTPANKSVALSVVKPDGSTLASASATSSYTFNLTNLPTTGTYQLLVDPAISTASLSTTKSP